MKQNWKYKCIKDICKQGSSNIIINKIKDNEGEFSLFGASGLVKKIDFFQSGSPYIGIVKDGSGVGKVNSYPAKSSLVGTMQYIFPNEGTDLSFLKYALQGLNLSSFASGAAIPHIYFKDYGKCKIHVPGIEVQRLIVEELDLIQSIIDKQKRQLLELDNLQQSIFHNMFGDPITNEKDFSYSPLKESVIEMFLGPFGSALKTSFYVGQDKSFCMVYEQKHAIKGTFNLENHFIDQERYHALKRFEVIPGDFIMSCRGTIGKVFLLPDNAPKGIIHPSLMKIRIKKEIYTNLFFEYLLKKIIEREHTKGNCVQMAITAKELGAKKVICPPLALQEEFAEKIEAIERQKELIKKSIADSEQLFNYTMDKYFG